MRARTRAQSVSCVDCHDRPRLDPNERGTYTHHTRAIAWANRHARATGHRVHVYLQRVYHGDPTLRRKR